MRDKALARRRLLTQVQASGFADLDYPQVSHSTQSRDAVTAEAMRANNGMHSTEILESQVQPPLASANLPASTPMRART